MADDRIEPPSDLSKRAGRFSISSNLFKQEPEALLAAMKQLDVLIMHAEHNLFRAEVDYEALCPHFRPIARGEQMPFYAFHLRKEGERTVVESVEEVEGR